MTIEVGEELRTAFTSRGAWNLVSHDVTREEGKELTKEEREALHGWLISGAPEIDHAAKEALSNLPDDQRVLFVLRKVAEGKQNKLAPVRRAVPQAAAPVAGTEDRPYQERWAAAQLAEKESDEERSGITAELMEIATLTRKIRQGYR